MAAASDWLSLPADLLSGCLPPGALGREIRLASDFAGNWVVSGLEMRSARAAGMVAELRSAAGGAASAHLETLGAEAAGAGAAAATLEDSLSAIGLGTLPPATLAAVASRDEGGGALFAGWLG